MDVADWRRPAGAVFEEIRMSLENKGFVPLAGKHAMKPFPLQTAFLAGRATAPRGGTRAALPRGGRGNPALSAKFLCFFERNNSRTTNQQAMTIS